MKNKVSKSNIANVMKTIQAGKDFNDFLVKTIKPITLPNIPSIVTVITRLQLKKAFILIQNYQNDWEFFLIFLIKKLETFQK